MAKTKFKPAVCECCQQTTEVDYALAKGHVNILLAIYNAVREKGVNFVHLNNEMLCHKSDFKSVREMVAAGRLTHTMINNTSTPRYHGLIAFADEGGAYLITPKGADFLFRNKAIPRTAIVDKKTHTKKFYLDETDTVTFGQLMRKETPWWDFNDATLVKLGLAERPAAPAEQASLI